MKTYKVTITEKLEMTVEVKASSRCEAEQLVEERWSESEYVLDASHFTGALFTAELPPRERGMER